MRKRLPGVDANEPTLTGFVDHVPRAERQPYYSTFGYNWKRGLNNLSLIGGLK
jgi:hypothetical protein